MKQKLFIFILGILILTSVVSAYVNPSAIFCEDSGYAYINEIQKDGSEIGYCDVLGELTEAWEYYRDNQLQDSAIKTMSSKKDKASSLRSSQILEIEKDNREVSTSSLKNSEFQTQSVSSIDWRNKDGKDWMTPVKNQGSCGACWAFSSLGVFESKININLNNATFNKDLSEQDTVSNSAGSCDGGWETDALSYAKSTGVVSEQCMPYIQSNGGTMCSSEITEKSKIGNYAEISPSVSAIKNAISSQGPVVAQIVVCGDFNSYSSGVYSHSGDVYWDDSCWNSDFSGFNWHSVAIVGYNDPGQYWIIKNSWGTGWWGLGWGEDGYARIAYSQSIYDYSSWADNVFNDENGDNRVLFLDDSYYITTTDVDNDGDNDGVDNCPTISNPSQTDVDSNGIGDVCDCIPNWIKQGASCQSNDGKLIIYNDLNQCGKTYGLPSDNGTFENCDYCAPTWSCSGYGECEREDVMNCNQTNDSNNCFSFTGLLSDNYSGNFLDFIPLVCDYCTPNMVNTTWGYWENITCSITDTMDAKRSLTQYDNNSCGEVSNNTLFDYNSSEFCDYCVPSIVNTSWGEWQNQGVCLEDDTWEQNRSLIEYDENYLSCYNSTKLETDLWNLGGNNTYFEYDYILCDYNNDGFIGNLSDINTSLNISLNLSENNTIRFVEENETLFEFEFNLTQELINLNNVSI